MAGERASAGEGGALAARFAIDEALLRRVLRTRLRAHTRFLRGLLWSLTALVVVVVLVNVPLGLVGGDAFFVLLLAFVALAAPRFVADRAVRRLAKARGVLGRTVVEVKDGWITERGAASSEGRRLDAVHALHRDPDMLVVELVPGSYLAIPAHADFGELDFETFRAELERRVAEARASASA